MSLKNPKHLLIIGAVVVALMVGTVLLGNYANILPARSGTQAKTCQAAGGTPCSGAETKSCSAGASQVAFAQQTGAGFDAKACPLGRTEPCCAGEDTTNCCPAMCCPEDCENCCCPAKCCPDKCGKCCCPKLCPPDCTKPCCAGEATPGCCPMPDASSAANTGCCSG